MAAQEGAGVLRRGASALFGAVSDVWCTIRSAGTAVAEVSNCPYFQGGFGRDDHTRPLEENRADLVMRCPYARAGVSLPANHPFIPEMAPTKTVADSSMQSALRAKKLAADELAPEIERAADDMGGGPLLPRAQVAAVAPTTRSIPFTHTQEAQAVALFKKAAATSKECRANNGL